MEEWLPAIGGVIISLIIPFVVNLCSTTEMTGNVKRILAIAFSVIAGIATGFITGAPTPETFLTWCVAIIGGVQVAYTAFKAVGVTDGMLEALLNVGNTVDKKDQ